MLGSNSNQEENIIVKKIEGPSVDEEYQVIATEDNIYYEEEEPQQTNKIKVVLPIIALLIGGGAFYLMQGKDKLEQSEKVVTSPVETTTKVSETAPIKKTIEEKLVVPKKEDNPPVIVTKSEPKVEKKVSTHYIEALAMPTVVEKEKKIKKVEKKYQIEKIISEKVKNIVVVTEPQVKQVVSNKIVHKKPKVKRVLVQKRKPTLIAHYEKIKPKIIHVRKGDTLLILAKRFYGNERDYKKIVRANRRIRSKKTTLHLGEKLIIPRKDNKTSRRYIIVEKGNTLAMIAKKFYGDERAISKIIRANHRIKSSRSMLRLGQKVYVPR